MALTPAGLEPAKPKILHPRLAELWLIRCQTSLKSLIYGANFRNYVRVTEFTGLRPIRLASSHPKSRVFRAVFY